jgi:hypothetical protein
MFNNLRTIITNQPFPIPGHPSAPQSSTLTKGITLTSDPQRMRRSGGWGKGRELTTKICKGHESTPHHAPSPRYAKAMNLHHITLPHRAIVSTHSGPRHGDVSTQLWARMPTRGHIVAPPSSQSLHVASPWI